MLHKLLFFTLLSSSVLLTACEKSKGIDAVKGLLGGVCDTSGGNGSEYMSGIVNGQKLGANNPFSSRIVSLIFKQGSESGICTGSLLPGNIVLTAAHCLPTSRSASDIRVFFTNNVNCVSPSLDGPEVRRVTALTVHPEYSGDDSVQSSSASSNDLGMLHFSGSLPEGYQTFEMPDSTLQLAASDNIVMAGFGVTNYENGDPGVLRITALPASKLTTESEEPKVLLVDQSRSGVCSGDSGSGLIVVKNGKLNLIGVASSVSNSSRIESLLCNDKSRFVSTSAQMPWIQKTYNSLLK